MTLLAAIRRMGNSMNWCNREPTIKEILSDSMIRAMMHADGVDPNELEAMLRRMALRYLAGASSGGREATERIVPRMMTLSGHRLSYRGLIRYQQLGAFSRIGRETKISDIHDSVACPLQQNKICPMDRQDCSQAWPNACQPVPQQDANPRSDHSYESICRPRCGH